MSFDVNAIVAAIPGAGVADAASAEHGARDRWVRCAKNLYKAGMRIEMLIKPAKDETNEDYSPVIVQALRDEIITGVSASKKTVKFSTPHPGASGEDSVGKASYPWTIRELLALNKDQLRAIDDDVLKNVRRTYMQLIDGPMQGRVRMYIDRIQNPDKERTAKTKTEAKTEATGEGFDLRTLEGVKGSVNGMLANLAHWCTPSARDQVENALRQLLVAMTPKIVD